MVDAVQPSRQQADLAEVIEMLLDKGIVINADIAVSIGDTQLLGIQLRAAIASFETAAKYGLEFPEGTDMRRVAEAVGEPELAEMDRPAPPVKPVRGVNMTPNPEEPEPSDSDGSTVGERHTGPDPDRSEENDEADSQTEGEEGGEDDQ